MNLRMPAPFPRERFQEFGRRAAAWFPEMLSTEDLDDRSQKGRHFERAWLAVAYRYRSCAEYNEEFKELLRGASTMKVFPYTMRLPWGCWPGRRKVLISSPSPQTVTLGNRLDHSPSGTSGSPSSQQFDLGSRDFPFLNAV
jgi:hypothetical protein